jgi:hypothetical protein
MCTTRRYWLAAFALSAVGIVPASSRAKVDMPMVDNKPTEYRFVMRAVGLDVYDRAVPTVEEANALTWAWHGGHRLGGTALGEGGGGNLLSRSRKLERPHRQFGAYWQPRYQVGVLVYREVRGRRASWSAAHA